jgi:hypothetical protein
MGDSRIEQVLILQNQLRIRLAELGIAESTMSSNLQRHLAEIAVLGRYFAEHTIPLFLSVSPNHGDSLASLAASIQSDLDELRDAVNDVQSDVIELVQYLRTECGG